MVAMLQLKETSRRKVHIAVTTIPQHVDLYVVESIA